MTDKELMQQALDALCFSTPSGHGPEEIYKDTIVALQNRLEQPEPEPVGYLTNALGHEWVFTTKRINQYSQPVYYTPPQRKEWQGLTDEEVNELISRWAGELVFEVEQALKEKNND